MSVLKSLKFYVFRVLPCLLYFVLSGQAFAAESRLLPLQIEGQGHEPLIFYVEVMKTSEERSKGLMGREVLPTGQGMLFDFGKPQIVRMWMKNTLISLDMMFIDQSGRVQYIFKNAHPMDHTIITSPMPVRWVLELNGGVSDILKIAVGDQIRSKEVEVFSKSK